MIIDVSGSSSFKTRKHMGFEGSLHKKGGFDMKRGIRTIGLGILLCVIMAFSAFAGEIQYELVAPFPEDAAGGWLAAVNEEHQLILIEQSRYPSEAFRVYNFQGEKLMEESKIAFGPECIYVRNREGLWGIWSYDMKCLVPCRFNEYIQFHEGKVYCIDNAKSNRLQYWTGMIHEVNLSTGAIEPIGRGVMGYITEDSGSITFDSGEEIKSVCYGGAWRSKVSAKHPTGIQMSKGVVRNEDGQEIIKVPVTSDGSKVSCSFTWPGRLLTISKSDAHPEYAVYSDRGRLLNSIDARISPDGICGGGYYVVENDKVYTIWDINGNSIRFPPSVTKVLANCAVGSINSGTISWKSYSDSLDLVLVQGLGVIRLPECVPEPSEWAVEDTGRAVSLGLVDEDIQWWWKDSCTREEFCRMLAAGLEQMTGKSQEELLTGLTKTTFSDCTTPEVELCSALGIVQGVGKEKFAPNCFITREAAATILSRAANYLHYEPNGEPMVFTDEGSFAPWAADAIQQASSIICDDIPLMQGTSGGAFSPKAFYTVEQAATTILRLTDFEKN